MIPIFVFSFLATSWTGSYIMITQGWKEEIVFTPKTVTDPQQIYEVDKFLYAFNSDPMTSILCILSFLILIVIIIYWISKKFGHNSKSIVN